MKKIFVIIPLFVLSVFIGCSQTSPQTAQSTPAGDFIKFEAVSHDFGTIAQNGNGSFDFIFSNTGKEPLLLKNVSTSCGCTVPEWPKEPIAPGAKGTVKVKYNTATIGPFTKTITVYSNGSTNPITLRINGTVEPPAPK
jgi:hypothetical protein